MKLALKSSRKIFAKIYIPIIIINYLMKCCVRGIKRGVRTRVWETRGDPSLVKLGVVRGLGYYMVSLRGESGAGTLFILASTLELPRNALNFHQKYFLMRFFSKKPIVKIKRFLTKSTQSFQMFCKDQIHY